MLPNNRRARCRMTSASVWLLSVCLLTPNGPGIEHCTVEEPLNMTMLMSDGTPVHETTSPRMTIDVCLSIARQRSHGNIQAHCTDDRGRVVAP
jgi:hypothetical protein